MNWKKIVRRLLFPPVWLLMILVLVCAAALTLVFRNGLDDAAPACAVYAASFYTLVCVCAFLGSVFSGQYKKAKRLVHENPLGNRYLTDVEFKNQVALCCSLAVNLLYAGTNAFSAFLYRSAWFGIFAGYYTILAVLRFLLVRYLRKDTLRRNRLTELQRARACSAILTTVSLVLLGMVFMILYQNKGSVYQGTLIYAAALVSMLSLETAMLSQFGEEMAPKDRRSMIIATGTGVSLLVTAMAVYMGVRSTREIRELRRQEYYGKGK